MSGIHFIHFLRNSGRRRYEGHPFDMSLDLHRAVFDLNEEKVRQLLADPNVDLNSKDLRGNTPLIISVQRGPVALPITRLLLEAGAIPDIQSNSWNAVQEAISVGHRDTIGLLLEYHAMCERRSLQAKTPELYDRLMKLGDFSLIVDWTLKSWVPFVGKFLPSDTITITKRGSCLRLDTTLQDFDYSGGWKRGGLSILLKYRVLSDEERQVRQAGRDRRKARLNHLEQLVKSAPLPSPLTEQFIADRIALMRADQRLQDQEYGVTEGLGGVSS